MVSLLGGSLSLAQRTVAFGGGNKKGRLFHQSHFRLVPPDGAPPPAPPADGAPAAAAAADGDGQTVSNLTEFVSNLRSTVVLEGRGLFEPKLHVGEVAGKPSVAPPTATYLANPSQPSGPRPRGPASCPCTLACFGHVGWGLRPNVKPLVQGAYLKFCV